jgi:hypothetical protein
MYGVMTIFNLKKMENKYYKKNAAIAKNMPP